MTHLFPTKQRSNQAFMLTALGQTDTVGSIWCAAVLRDEQHGV